MSFWDRCRVLWIALLLAGGSAASPPQSFAAGEATRAEQAKEAPCAVCSVREKAGPEAVAATWEYEGRSYSFCSEACKTEFQQDPKKWTRAAQVGRGAAPHAEHGAASAAPGSAAPS
jgi:YHS domain-containing protein